LYGAGAAAISLATLAVPTLRGSLGAAQADGEPRRVYVTNQLSDDVRAINVASSTITVSRNGVPDASVTATTAGLTPTPCAPIGGVAAGEGGTAGTAQFGVSWKGPCQ
jgi:hypothetical protein